MAGLMEQTVHLLRLCELGRVRDALASFYALNSTSLHQASTYAVLFHACARHGLLAEGQVLHRHMLSSAPSGGPAPNLFVSNHLVNMYCKCGRLDVARQLFDAMPRRNLVSWTSLLTGYGQHGRHDDCFLLFSAMLSHHLPNEFSLGSVLSSCAASKNGHGGRQVHALTQKTSLDAHVNVGNALITMYSSCPSDEGIGNDDGWWVFQTMPHRSVISWNSMISGFLIKGHLDCSMGLFAGMLREGIMFDHCTLVGVISSCSSLGQCRLLHSLVVKSSFSSRVEVSTVLLKAYAGVGGAPEELYKVFSEARQKDIMSWTSIISTFAEQDPQEAARVFCRMRREGFYPDKYTFSTMVKACANLTTESRVSAIHALIAKSGFEGDVVLCNSLVHAYARCGNITLSELVFEQMAARDIVTWNSMIKAYSIHGRGRDALRTFSRMDVPPDSATFVGLLSACSHSGMIDEGRALFHAMSDEYGLVPELDHFACMVDILGRAGHILEAEELVNQMPMEPDSVVWSGLLGACRKHGEVKIAEKAAQKLMDLAPQKSVGHILISNIYCARGTFGDAAPVWKGMRDLGVKKQPGLSWIEIGNRIHEFSVGGHRHPQIEDIRAELKCLVDKVKEIGYIPETNLVLHEIAEEYKEEQLYFHSEKLALVFGLMNASSSQACIKIMKNIRICVDCHKFITLVSKCANKEIVVRDANRFHHFKDGECSCGDYW
ncbi:hypothetical protein Taro_054217 [Colocasia esculenta]|uniref:DYW domain-containing protein n=1 Tax=Colocasia esculenta TaxID=4460 RepID=A0A843XPU1_COLES|nr:hypothetical protein [Colocasia esculenta]